MARGVINQLPLYQRYSITSPVIALRKVVSKDGLGVYASSDELFKGAIFGRDSIEVAEDIIKLRPKLVDRVILTLASLQGEEYRDENEEEPGKIIHEYRRSVVDGKVISGTSAQLFKQLSGMWGGNDDSMEYYGSVDATPHFVRLVHKYVLFYGPKILETPVILRSGYKLNLKIVVENAVSWVIDRLDDSRSGLLEYLAKNQRSNFNKNQVWKDSNEFYIHNDGTSANHKSPISSVEVQALAYDALIGASRLFPPKKDFYEQRAKALRDRTIELLWSDEQGYFHLGTDYDDEGGLRIMKVKTANPAEMLESTFFDLIPSYERRKYIKGIVSQIMSDDFLTDGGIRSRAKSEAGLVEFWDYHGSFTSWPKETYDIAKGLRRHGFNRLARQLEYRLLNIIRALKAYPEFIYVDARGRVLGAASTSHHHSELVLIEGENRPERVQAWTVSAVLALTSSNKRLTIPLPRLVSRKKGQPSFETWQGEFEKEVLSHIPVVPLLKTQRELAARYPSYPYKLGRKTRIE